MCVCVCVSCLVVSDSLQPTDCSPPAPSIHRILQARTLEWVAISFSKKDYRKKESEVAQSCPTLCDPMDCSLPGSSIHGIFQARVLEWVAIFFSSFQDNFNLLRVNILKIYKEVSASSALAKSFLYSQSMGVSAHSPLTLCNPMDCSPPGSPVHGTLQARILEWVASHSLLWGIFITQ